MDDEKSRTGPQETLRDAARVDGFVEAKSGRGNALPVWRQAKSHGVPKGAPTRKFGTGEKEARFLAGDRSKRSRFHASTLPRFHASTLPRFHASSASAGVCPTPIWVEGFHTGCEKTRKWAEASTQFCKNLLRPKVVRDFSRQNRGPQERRPLRKRDIARGVRRCFHGPRAGSTKVADYSYGMPCWRSFTSAVRSGGRSTASGKCAFTSQELGNEGVKAGPAASGGSVFVCISVASASDAAALAGWREVPASGTASLVSGAALLVSGTASLASEAAAFVFQMIAQPSETPPHPA